MICTVPKNYIITTKNDEQNLLKIHNLLLKKDAQCIFDLLELSIKDSKLDSLMSNLLSSKAYLNCQNIRRQNSDVFTITNNICKSSIYIDAYEYCIWNIYLVCFKQKQKTTDTINLVLIGKCIANMLNKENKEFSLIIKKFKNKDYINKYYF
jgi:hypothetical protein